MQIANQRNPALNVYHSLAEPVIQTDNYGKLQTTIINDKNNNNK